MSVSLTYHSVQYGVSLSLTAVRYIIIKHIAVQRILLTHHSREYPCHSVQRGQCVCVRAYARVYMHVCVRACMHMCIHYQDSGIDKSSSHI